MPAAVDEERALLLIVQPIGAQDRGQDFPVGQRLIGGLRNADAAVEGMGR